MSQIFTHERLSQHVTRIVMPGSVCVYLVEGSERAVLLDTGFGFGDLRGYVEGLCDKPYDVVLSHGHLDHAGGAGQWQDRPVYLNERDWELVEWHTTLERRISDVHHGPGGMPEGVSDEDFLPDHTGEWVNVDEGNVFELGGVDVSFIAVPGHTPGMLVPLIEPDRMAIFGDACGEQTLCQFGESLPMADFKQSLLHLKEFEDRFDEVLRNHGTFCSPKSLLDRNLMLCERVLAGTDDHVPVEIHEMPGLLASAEKGPDIHGNIVYRPDDPTIAA